MTSPSDIEMTLSRRIGHGVHREFPPLLSPTIQLLRGPSILRCIDLDLRMKGLPPCCSVDVDWKPGCVVFGRTGVERAITDESMKQESTYAFHSRLCYVRHGNSLHVSSFWITVKYESMVRVVSHLFRKSGIISRAAILGMATSLPPAFGCGFSANLVGEGKLFRIFCRKMDGSFTIE